VADKLTEESRLEIYRHFVSIVTHWNDAMDMKANFISVFNTALLGFLFTQRDLFTAHDYVKCLFIAALVCGVVSLFMSFFVVLPKLTLKSIMGQDMDFSEDFKPVSFFNFITVKYKAGAPEQYVQDMQGMDLYGFQREALGQHFVISHRLKQKSDQVRNAGVLAMIGLFVATSAVLYTVL